MDEKAKNDRDALNTNRKRQKEDQERYLSEVRVAQANSGTMAGTGSSLLVFDDITSRLDERLADFTNSSLAEIARTESSARMTRFSGKQQAKATRLTTFGNLAKGAASSFSTFNKVSDVTTPGQSNGLYSLFS